MVIPLLQEIKGKNTQKMMIQAGLCERIMGGDFFVSISLLTSE